MGKSKEIKTYSELAGDGGSDIMGQVIAHKAKIEANLSGIKQVIAVGSGKGGVGKSTISMYLASAFNRLGKSVSLLDADVNGPALARFAGLTDVLSSQKLNQALASFPLVALCQNQKPWILKVWQVVILMYGEQLKSFQLLQISSLIPIGEN